MTLEELLVQVRRIEKSREAGAEENIRKAYQSLLKKLNHFLAEEYTKLAEEDKLTYEILQKHSRYANFLETVEKHINTMTPLVADTIQTTVKQTYKAVYDGMVSSVKKAGNLHENLKGLKACTPEVLKRAVENPVSGLTLKDTLEKHRKDVIYDIKQQIGIGLSNGDRFSTMANRVKDSLQGDYEKAIRIVRTETHWVREAGSQDAAQEVSQALKKAESPTMMMKTWKTMKDERVRPNRQRKKTYNHVKMDGVTIPVEEEFTLPSGAKTKAPGNSGVAGEDIHCRCYLAFGLQKMDKGKMAGKREDETLEWSETRAKKLQPDERKFIEEYAAERNVTLNNIKLFDGDVTLLARQLDSFDMVRKEFPDVFKKPTTFIFSDRQDDNTFAVTQGNVITFNRNIFRDRKITEDNIKKANIFTAENMDDIVTHEAGHIISSIKGENGVAIAQKTYYNLFQEEASIDNILAYLNDNISTYAIEYYDSLHKRFSIKNYRDVLPEILVKNKRNPTKFTEEFIRIVKGGSS